MLVVGAIGMVVGGTFGGVVAYNSAKSSGLEGSELALATLEGVAKGAVIGAVVGGLIGATGGAIAAYGALSAGGTAFITGSITIAAKMTEVGALQGRKSQSEGDNGWQIANDCVDSIFKNTFKVISPIGTKTLTTATTFWVTDIAKHKVVPLTAEAFLKGPCGKLLPYGLATYGVLNTVYAFFCADPVERANQRGYGLK